MYVLLCLCVFSTDYNLAHKMLSCASSVLGQSLMETSSTKAVIRRKALVSFVDAVQ